MGPPGHVTDVGDGPSGACFWLGGPMDGWVVFFVLGTYGGWVATLENPFGTLVALETLGTLCVALCGDKVRTNFHVSMSLSRSEREADVSGEDFFTMPSHVCSAVPLLP